MTQSLDEHARQRALDTYRIVDSLPEAAYDDIVRLASILCDTPIALVSLVDRDRQWFKARTGLELTQTHRSAAICDHAIRTPDELFEVQDLPADARFAANPLVVGEDGVRFYAGMPPVTPGGAPIGTVCVLDRQPRELDASQREALASLARLTMNLMNGHQRERELQREAMLTSSAAETTAAEPAPAAPKDERCTVAIVEVQELAAVAERIGTRALERALHALDAALEGALDRVRGDCVNRASGSGEAILVLHRSDADATLAALREQLPDIEARTGLRLLLASAASSEDGESMAGVFLRADDELSRLKDAALD